jgi:hypothetical protein
MASLKKRVIGISLLLLTLLVVSVSAYVYESGTIAVTQTIKNIATLTVQNSALGNIEEGQTIFYTKVNASILGSILNLTTTKDNVYLHLNSNVDSLSAYYGNYTIVVKYAAIGAGSSYSVGGTACTMTLAAPNATSVTMDKAGAWRFDFEITTTAKSVSSDQATTVTIVVTAEST